MIPYKCLCLASINLIGMLSQSSSAASVPVPASSLNVRTPPVALGKSSETSLQQILDGIYGKNAILATRDQQTAGMWKVDPLGPAGGNVPFALQIEYAGYAGSNQVWLWSTGSVAGDSTSNLHQAMLFSGPMDKGDSTTVSWDLLRSTMTIDRLVNNKHSASTYAIGAAGYINPYEFGFFLDGPATSSGTSHHFWSVDSLNAAAGAPQLLSYLGADKKGAALWTFAFEDTPYMTGDHDFNDMVFTAKHLAIAPEPAESITAVSLLVVLLMSLRYHRTKCG